MARLEQEDAEARVEALDGWSIEGDALTKDFDRGDFAGSVAFVNALTPVAEEMNHHPDLAISWDTVTVSLSTHSEGGLTAADFDLAERIESLA